MSVSLRASSRRRGNGIGAVVAAGSRKARKAVEEAGDALHRGTATATRAERRLVSRAERAGRDALAAVRRRPRTAVAAALAGAGLLYLFARMRRG